METAVIVVLVLLAILALFCLWGLCTFCARRHRRRATFQDLESQKYWIGPNPTEASTTTTVEKIHITQTMEHAHRLSLTACQNFCRSCSHERTITDNLDFIGSHKFHCLVNDAKVNTDQGNRVRVILSCVEMKLRKSSREHLTKLLLALRHPYVLDCLDMGYSKDETYAFFLRPWSPEGSLRDFIHQVQPTQKFHVKYKELRDRQSPRGISVENIRMFGRQILEGLAYFRALGIPYVNLHSGNVILFGGMCKLTDYEDCFCGPKTHAFMKLCKYKSSDPIVSAFGLMLYEMANGYALPTGSVIITADKPGYTLVNQVLNLIFDKGTTFRELLDHSFFQVKVHTINLDQHSRPDSYVKDSKPTQRMLSRLTAEWSVNAINPASPKALPAPVEPSPKQSKAKGSKKKKPLNSDSDSKGSESE